MLDCKYRILHILRNCLTQSNLSLFQFSFLIFLISKKIYNFHILLNELNINLDMIAITVSRI